MVALRTLAIYQLYLDFTPDRIISKINFEKKVSISNGDLSLRIK